jgi:hypothetical protein
MSHYAPIVLFVYARPEHTRRTLEALAANPEAKDSLLYVFADGPPDGAAPGLRSRIEEVRRIVRERPWCGEVRIIESNVNRGLADSIVSGVTEVVERHGKIIVLEDDIVTSPAFLQFMNDALRVYENVEDVAGVSGFHVNHGKTFNGTYFLKKTTSWGWATFRRAWGQLSFDARDLYNQLLEKNVTDFNFKHGDYLSMLEDRCEGKNSSWAICFYASVFLQDRLFLYPGTSLCANIGFGDEATHTKGNIGKSFEWDFTALPSAIHVRFEFPKEDRLMRTIWEKSLKQHDGRSWKVLVNRFLRKLQYK